MPTLEEDIKKRVKEQLRWDDRVMASDINVEVDRGIVRLSGSVPSYASLRNAEVDALSVRGVNGIDNQLVISYHTEVEVPTDAEIEDFVNKMYRFNENLSSDEITVISENGYITLSGSTSALWKKLLAEELCHSVRGVVEVTNEITIVPTGSLGDENIANTIMAALERDAYTDQDSIIVRVENGIVSLSGTSNSRMGELKAEAIASQTEGVIEVVNEIESVRSNT
ncbi:MAG: BON domain-containing protein [Cyclobacteriaceae bacterium]